MLSTKKILLVLILLYIIPWGAVFGDWAWYFAWGNIMFHLLGGFFIALLVTSYYANEFNKLSQPFRFFCILGIVIGIGVFWEFYEITANAFLGNILPGLNDTMQDLLMDTLGGIAGAIVS